MDKSARKAAAAAYKERRANAGIYALRCLADDRVWVGQAQNIVAQRNQVDFSLANGGFLNRDLCAAVQNHGAAAFSFEVLETLAEPDEGLDAYTRRQWLIERGRFWRRTLQAQTV